VTVSRLKHMKCVLYAQSLNPQVIVICAFVHKALIFRLQKVDDDIIHSDTHYNVGRLSIRKE
jgi:hypothetical protein